MECTIQKRDLITGLRFAQSIADRESAMPILANVLLRTIGQNKLFIAATDLNITVAAELVSENADEWALTASAKHLHDIVSRLPDGPIRLNKSGRRLQLAAGNVECELPTMPVDVFPRGPATFGLEFGEIDSAVLREMIDRTLFSVSNDETRFHLNGVFFECDGETARMVSTNGHRLSRIDRPLAGGPNLSAGIIVPKKGMQEIKKIIDSASKVSLAVKSPYLFARGVTILGFSTTLAVRLIESQFPPYEQVIPTSHDIEVILDGSALLAALWRSLPIGDGVRLRNDSERISLKARAPDIASQSETIVTQCGPEEWDLCFHPRYWYEHIESMAPGEIVLRMSHDRGVPVTVHAVDDPDHVALIMQMLPWD
jgi:DNA polymerase-3 subunit beta